MAFKVELKDNSKIVLRTMDGNKKAALTAMGIKGVNLCLYQMRQGYGKPIRKKGDLQRDLDYDASDRSVKIGNSLHYSTFVHEGTSKMDGRPYIRDGLAGEGHAKQLQEVAEEALKKGF